MVYATWRDELQAFEAECDRLRLARRASFPTKVLGLAPLATVPFIAKMPLGKQLLAGVGIAVGAISLLSELDKQREVYGGNLKLDLNPNSDWDNLAGAFETRSPRWRSLAFLYSQLDPIHLKDRLSHLPDDEATKVLNRAVRRVQKGLGEIGQLNPMRPSYADELLYLTAEWAGDVTRILDRALFNAGAIDEQDLDESLLDELEEVEIEGTGEAGKASAGVASPAFRLFDWGDIKRHPDHYPHLLLLGKTGAGKTWLGERLLLLLGGDALVIHPHAAPRDFSGFKVIGGGRNYEAITNAIAALHSEMDLRYQRRDRGDESYNPLTVLIDEFPSIAHFCGKDVVQQILALVREARKVQIRLVILSQGAEVKALGIEGQGSVRECFTFIRLKGFAEDAARKQDPAIASWIAQQRFPCMVENQPADSSVLTTLEPLGKPHYASTSPTSPAAVSSPFEVRVDDTSAPVEVDYHLLPEGTTFTDKPALSSDSDRLLRWLQRKAEKGRRLFTPRELSKGKPLGEFYHSGQVLQPPLSELFSLGYIRAAGTKEHPLIELVGEV